jgi:hypothetical protein
LGRGTLSRLRPQLKRLLLTFVVALFAFVGSQTSNLFGYFLALLALLAIIIAMHTNSIWPTRKKVENPYVFSLFWGAIIGLLIPFLLKTYLKGGLNGIYEMLLN